MSIFGSNNTTGEVSKALFCSSVDCEVSNNEDETIILPPSADKLLVLVCIEGVELLPGFMELVSGGGG